MRAKGRTVPSSANASFVEARKQLPMELLQKVHRSVCDQLDQCLSDEDLWRGFRVKAEDDTSAQMRGTAAKQGDYPQPSSQAPGCGFPMMQLSGLIDLSHGRLRDFAASKIESGEQRCRKVAAKNAVWRCIPGRCVTLARPVSTGFKSVSRFSRA